MVTSTSTRVFRPALLVSAALFVALLATPRAARAAGHGGGGGHGGGSGGGGGSHGGGSHGGGSQGSRSHVSGVHASGSGAFRSSSSHSNRFNGPGFHRDGFNHHFRRGIGFRRFGFGFPFFDWGWGWAPYYSTWWWGGPSAYVVSGDEDGYGSGSGYGGGATRTGRHAVVKTDVSPEEAQVFLDGKYIGTADDFDGSPDYLYLGPGKYHVEFRLPGYATYATDLDVARGQRVSLDEKLKLEPGKSALDQFAPEAKGTPLGRVFTKGGPGADDEAAPAPRRGRRPYDERSDRDSAPAPRGYDGWSDREPAPRDRAPEARADVRDEPLPRHAGNRARMRFRVTPEDAAVYVDDKYLGAGEDLAANPRGVLTDPGSHTITVTRPGYKSKTVDVTVRVGSPVDVVVELEK